VADVQTQWERALREGATVVMESTEFPFGERQFTVQDPWGHQWTFSQTIAPIMAAMDVHSAPMKDPRVLAVIATPTR
jgi:hypothetical protein